MHKLSPTKPRQIQISPNLAASNRPPRVSPHSPIVSTPDIRPIFFFFFFLLARSNGVTVLTREITTSFAAKEQSVRRETKIGGIMERGAGLKVAKGRVLTAPRDAPSASAFLSLSLSLIVSGLLPSRDVLVCTSVPSVYHHPSTLCTRHPSQFPLSTRCDRALLGLRRRYFAEGSRQFFLQQEST